MRITDALLAIPYIILAIAIATMFGRSENSVILVLGLTGWLAITRIVRANFLSLKRARVRRSRARARAISRTRIIFRHILPNALQPIIVYGTIAVGGVILAEAALAYLGVGVQDPTPAWGLMVLDGKGNISQRAAHHLLPGHGDLPDRARVRVHGRRPARRARPEAQRAVVKEVLLSVRDLQVRFDTDDGEVKAVDGVSFDVHRGEVFAIVGESGSGKSVTAMSMLGLIPNARIAGGEAMWKDDDLLHGATRRDAQDPRWRDRDHLPGSAHRAEPGAQDRPADRRDGAHPPGRVEEGSARTVRSSCSTLSASRKPSAASTATRTSSRAACASGR